MATTLTPNLKLRIDSNLTANSKYNLSRIDLLGATFLVDSTNTVNLRSQVGILIEPNSADIGGSGIGGTIDVGTTNHKLTAVNIYTADLNLDGAFNLKDQASTSTGKLGLIYNSTAAGSKDDASRTLTLDVEGENRQLILAGNLSLLGGSLVLNLSGSTNLNLPTSGTLVARNTSDILTNKTIDADSNNIIRHLRNDAIANNAEIDYLKLNLLNSIKNEDVATGAQIAGNKIIPEFTQSVKTTGMLELDNGVYLTKIAPAENGQTASLTFKLPNSYGTANQVLRTDGSGNTSWFNVGTGTVTSVGLTVPTDIFFVSPNAITTADTFTLTKVNQAPNQVYAGPTTGASAEPSFRPLVLTDLPPITASDVGLGNVPNEDATNPVNIDWSPDYRTVTDTEKSTWNAKQDALGFTPENVVNKGQPDGYAPLNSSGRIDNAYLNTSVMNYHGTWDALTNTPALTDGMIGADPGDIYIVSVSGTQNLGSGSISFLVGDWIIYDQANVWQKVSNSSAVTSVNGAQGAVTVNAINELTGDITAGPASGSQSRAATITDGAITNSKISALADIAVSKLAPGTNDQVLTTVAGVPTWATASGGGGTTDPTALTNAQATRLGYKKYISGTAYKDGIVPTITSSIVEENPITTATLIPYLTQEGTWRLKGNIPPIALNNFYSNLGTAFNSNQAIATIAIQTDGKVLVGGSFTTFNGVTRNCFLRLNADGTEDLNFTTNLGTGAGTSPNFVNTIAIQSDGKILVGGAFTTFNGIVANRLIRFNTDGTQDTAFNNNLGTGFGSTVNTIAIQSDGKILVGGAFTTFNGAARNGLIRLNSNGTEDTAFSTNIGTAAASGVLVIQSDGKILVGGSFTSFNGLTRNRLVRLNTTGLEDTSFYTNLGTAFNGQIFTLALQSDGKILVGGAFTTLNGSTRNRLVRLSSSGSEDTSFYANLGTAFGTTVSNVAIQSDNKILVAGPFTTFNNITKNRLVRLNSDGTEDVVYNSIINTAFNNAANTIALRPNNTALIGGAFTIFNSTVRYNIVELLSTGKESGYSSYIYTLTGITFSENQSVNTGLGIGNTSAASNTIAAGPYAVGLSLFPSKSGATFDVDLSSEPTWAYTIDAAAPQIVSVVPSEISSTQYSADLDFISNVVLSAVDIYKYDGATWNYYGSIAIPGSSPVSLGTFNRPAYGSSDDQYKVQITNEAGSAEETFTIPAQATATVPQIYSAAATPVSGYDALLQVDYVNTATNYFIEQNTGGGSWINWSNGSVTGTSPLYLSINRPLPPSANINYRISLSNFGGSSLPSEFLVTAPTGTPSTIGMLTEGLGGTADFNIQIQYFMGSQPVSMYWIEQYVGTENPYGDYNPANWIPFANEAIFAGSPVTTSTFSRPVTSTTYRVRVGNMGVIDSYSNWNFIMISPL